MRQTRCCVFMPELRSAPRIMTEVVPSPTSSSCVLLSSMMLCAAQSAVIFKEWTVSGDYVWCSSARAFAAGCETSISRSIALPSFVRMMPAGVAAA